jgi:hypothetical protein
VMGASSDVCVLTASFPPQMASLRRTSSWREDASDERRDETYDVGDVEDERLVLAALEPARFERHCAASSDDGCGS